LRRSLRCLQAASQSPGMMRSAMEEGEFKRVVEGMDETAGEASW